MKKIIYLAIIIILLISCKRSNTSIGKAVDKAEKTPPEQVKITTLKEKIANLKNANSSAIMVIAHRGDWRNTPENSIQAIQNSIEMGVDMVEIDVRKTKDNHLIIMHDLTLDRTTTGKGYVADWTLDSLRTLHLKNGVGHKSRHKIPTLKEALLTAKGKVLINLDKCYEYFDDAYKIIQETETVNQVVLKGFNKTVEQVKADIGTKLDSIIFMPVINLDQQKNALKIINNYQEKIKPLAIEIVFSKDTSNVLSKFDEIKKRGSRVWVNSLWASLNSGYDDDKAVKHTDSIYGWYVKKGVNMIQTDRPKLLLTYLRGNNLHD